MTDPVDPAAAPPNPAKPLAWLPNALTMARVALAPAVLFGLVAPALVVREPLILTVWTAPAAGLILLAALLDWLDGRLARAWSVESDFGRFWDPVADKLVVGAGLIGAAAALPTMLVLLPVALLLWRDAMVTWLRMRSQGAATIATPLRRAKWKTAAEYLALVVLLSATAVARTLGGGADAAQTSFIVAGLGLLWLACGLSLWTGGRYAMLALRAS